MTKGDVHKTCLKKENGVIEVTRDQAKEQITRMTLFMNVPKDLIEFELFSHFIAKKKKKITKQRDLNFETFVDFHFVFDFWKTFTVFFLLNIRNFVRKIKKENHF